MSLHPLIKPATWLAHTWQNATRQSPYIGRFAPSPSGSLHQGSLVAAMASYVHAHWHGGTWLVRMEDVDTQRCTRACGEAQLALLRELGFEFDGNVMWQTEHFAAYRAALEQLIRSQQVVPCGCSRSNFMDNHARCLAGDVPHIHSWRFKDVVLHRPPDEWTYALAVVVDDAAQGVTHVVRGADLYAYTPQQIDLQTALGLPHPVYEHTPIVLDANGRKISKSDQAPAIDTHDGVAVLMQAWCFLGGCEFTAQSTADFWATVLPIR